MTPVQSESEQLHQAASARTSSRICSNSNASSRGDEGDDEQCGCKRRRMDCAEWPVDGASAPTQNTVEDSGTASSQQKKTESSVSSGLDILSLIPDALAINILLRLPPPDVARSCALVSTHWAALSHRQELWKAVCEPWGLTAEDASQVLGSWKGLYSVVFGANLVSSPCFESLPQRRGMREPIPNGDSLEGEDGGLFEAVSMEHVDSFPSVNETEQEYRQITHWVEDREDVGAGIVAPFWARSSSFRTMLPSQSHSLSSFSSSSCSDSDSDSCSPSGRPFCHPSPGSHHKALPPCTSCHCKAKTTTNTIQHHGSNPIMCCGAEEDALLHTSCQIHASATRTDSSQGSAEAVRTAGAVGAAGTAGEAGAVGVGQVVAMGAMLTSRGFPKGDLWESIGASTGTLLKASMSGQVKQRISLANFPARLLDLSPPLSLSAWYTTNAGNLTVNPESGEEGNVQPKYLRLRAVLLEGDGVTPCFFWDSGKIDVSKQGWEQASGCITGYPKGMRSILVKVSGEGVCFTQVRANFFTGPLDKDDLRQKL